jgi:pyridoxamine 5'-phosphate oxidase
MTTKEYSVDVNAVAQQAVDPHPWAGDLTALHAQIWARLMRGVRDRHAPARHPTFATVSPDGWPQARTVVLRTANEAEGTLDIHTDLRSAKIVSLESNPRAAIHIWDGSAHLQTRIEAIVTILTGDVVASYWEKLPEQGRQNYGTTPPPGEPIANSLDYAKQPDQTIYAVLRCSIRAIDAVHLGPQHRRARFDYTDNRSGQWLVP